VAFISVSPQSKFEPVPYRLTANQSQKHRSVNIKQPEKPVLIIQKKRKHEKVIQSQPYRAGCSSPPHYTATHERTQWQFSHITALTTIQREKNRKLAGLGEIRQVMRVNNLLRRLELKEVQIAHFNNP
jgi:hypothetical protein